MSLKVATETLVAEFRSRPTIRAGSLIITMFGDAIAPRGGTAWVGSLIRAVADLGINERLVRTSVFRLSRDDWLEATQIGRRSYYSLSNNGAADFEHATARIYGDPRQLWKGDWCLVLLGGLDVEHKEVMRKELRWLGFGAISANVMAHPIADVIALEALLKNTGTDGKVVVMRGQTLGRLQDDGMRMLVHKSWNLEEIDKHYKQFIERFRPVYREAREVANVGSRVAFQIRTLLIHEYRRILLRDPLLPTEMLPPGWNGTTAYQLCRNLYRVVFRAADEFMGIVFETAEGPLPPPAPEFYDRFGGLD